MFSERIASACWLISRPTRRQQSGGCLQVEGGALILGAALPELAHGVEAGSGVPFGALAESKQRAFRLGEERLPGQLAQFGQCS